MDKDTKDLAKRILAATTPEEVFGKPPVTATDPESHAKAVYRELMKRFHADLNDPSDKDVCDRVTGTLPDFFADVRGRKTPRPSTALWEADGGWPGRQGNGGRAKKARPQDGRHKPRRHP